ncbi:hypothetical protein LHJ74_29540 [Streptomyces sp. N2-109]|uniref:Lipoprotein n=1 Tax=Streptomyces gossypii TaxID=2883101 RepID=A0ABT2K300_9ACTN|nr:hypothetical protein [Streptomyces gossypii]MCT2594004.1 hypothetical protein [Streptomyces gossypii]
MRRVTEAVLLMGATVSALSGCVTVPGSSTPGGADAPRSASESAGGPTATPRAAKPSARVGMSHPDAERSRSERREKGAAPGTPRADPPPRRPAVPIPVPLGPEALRRQGAAPPQLQVPAQGGAGGAGGVDGPGGTGGTGGADGVCGLGQQYGRWDPNGPAANICRENYGN